MNFLELNIADLPACCFVNESARRLAGRVLINRNVLDELGRLRIEFHGGNDPASLECVEIVLKSIPHVFVAISASHQRIAFSENCVGHWVFRLFGEGGNALIGDGVSCNGAEVLINDNGRLVVEEDCMFAAGVTIHVGDNHAVFDLGSGRVINYRTQPFVKLGRHVSVGQRASIIGDCVIGNGAILASYSVCNSDIPDISLAAGVPARVERRNVSWTRSYQGEEIATVREQLLSDSASDLRHNEIDCITAEDVRMAYRYILGRDAENSDVVAQHMKLGTVANLRSAMILSQEFQNEFHARYRRFPHKWVAVDVLDQFTMWIDLNDRFVSAGCLNNDWEPSESRYVASKLKAGDVVLDIGANIGWFSLLAAKCTGESGVIHAFEPRAQTAAMLSRTIKDNKLNDRIRLWELALSDNDTDSFLTWDENEQNPGHSFLSENKLGPKPRQGCKVRCAKLDVVLPDVAPDFIKIDVEGAEPKVIIGAISALSRKFPPILSELYPDQLKMVSDVSAADYINILAEFGYRCFLLENGVPTVELFDFPLGINSDLVSVVFEKNV